MLKNRLTKIKGFGKNLFDRKNKLIYVIESADWSIKWDGLQLTRALNKNDLIKSDIITIPYGLKDKLIHFGSINTILHQKRVKNVDNSNKVILSWFHVLDKDERIKFIPDLLKKVNIFHTASENTKSKLLAFGIPQEKIVVIPLGIDLKYFKPMDKNKIKQKLNLPLDKIIIGSFQKDGIGWKEGLEPKLIKGPDIFCDVVEQLSKTYKIFVLLTGPARGYVKKRLEKAKIPYLHNFLKNYFDLVDYFNCLDLYLCTSREEGGPKAILECWSTGVPLVSTKVGMIPDFSIDKEDALLTELEHTEELIKKAITVINNKNLARKLARNGLEKVQNFSWDKIANQYYEKIYKNLI